MNISLSGNSGSGDCRQEFWLAGEDLQNVGCEPRGCLASWTGNLLQNLIFTLIFIVQGARPWLEGEGRMRRETERGKATEVHSNRRHVKEKKKKGERSERKCEAAAGLFRQQVLQAAAACTWLGGSGSPAQAAQRVLLLLRRALWYQNKSVLQHAIERKLGEGRTSLSLVEKIHLGPFKFHILVAEGSSGTRL